MSTISSSNTDPAESAASAASLLFGRAAFPHVWSQPTDLIFGRERELTIIASRIGETREGLGSTILLSGEAGIGKTTLARNAAELAHQHQLLVLWTRVIEGDWQPPYQPWIEIISQGIEALAWPKTGSDPPAWAATVSTIVPALTDIFPQLIPLGPLSALEEQYRLADAVVQCLLDLARRSPILIIFDDIQWADPESLRLLRQLGQIRRDAALLILALVRDDEIHTSEPLNNMLGHLRREDRFVELRLAGLDRNAVATLVARMTSSRIPTPTVQMICESTQGNPFFVLELTRHLDEEGRLDLPQRSSDSPRQPEFTVPQSLIQVIERRLSRLSPPTQHTLRLAAICTDGFDFRMLSALTALDDETLLDAIDEALASRLIAPVEQDFERYDFPHALVRYALYESWSPSRRIRLHRQLAVSLEQIHAADPSRHAAELAVHYHISLGLPEAERGVPYALAAARNAEVLFAPEQAVTYYRIACDLARSLPTLEQARISSQLALAEAHALMLEACHGTIEHTITLFEAASAPPGEIARFLAHGVTGLHDGGADPATWMPLVYRGLALTPTTDELTWARLTLLIPRFELIVAGIINGSRWLGSNQHAVDIARASNDEDLFARSLQPWDLWDRDWTARLTDLVQTWRTPNAIIRALTVSGADWLYHHGDFRRSLAHFDNLLTIAERQGSIPGQAEASVRLGIIHTVLGNFTQAQEVHQRARSLVNRLGPGHRLHASLWWMNALWVDVEAGDWSEIAAYFVDYVGDPDIGKSTIAFDDGALAAMALANLGQTDAALLILRPLAALLDRLEPDLWLLNGTVGFGAAAVWELKRRDLAEPFRASALAIIAAGHGDFPGASNFLSVARMASLLGHHDEAADYFQRARMHLDQSGQRPLRARVDLDEATALLNGPDHHLDRALTLGRIAQRSFSNLGMDSREIGAAEAIGKIERRIAERMFIPAGLTQREIDVVRLVTRGLSDRQIGDDLFVSPRTVNAHVRNILAKTGCANRTELSVWAVEQGIAGKDHPQNED